MKNISFGRAFKYALTKKSYVVSLVIFSILGIGAIIGGFLLYKSTDNAVFGVIGLAIGLVSILTSLLAKPASVAANTTEEQADRGVYIW
jgi:hypothetical protein